MEGWTDERGRNEGLVVPEEGGILTGGLGVEGGIAFQRDGAVCTRPGRGRKCRLCWEQSSLTWLGCRGGKVGKSGRLV